MRVLSIFLVLAALPGCSLLKAQPPPADRAARPPPPAQPVPRPAEAVYLTSSLGPQESFDRALRALALEGVVIETHARESGVIQTQAAWVGDEHHRLGFTIVISAAGVMLRPEPLSWSPGERAWVQTSALTPEQCWYFDRLLAALRGQLAPPVAAGDASPQR